uniref:Alkylmercury lyase n=1 Tax=Thermorudis peleae TaxID=1382356 RepID=A0A831TBD9_9BACT
MTHADPGAKGALAQRWLACAAQQRQTLEYRLTCLAFERIADGQPLPLGEAQAALGKAPEDSRDLIDRMARQGRLTLDEHGDAIVAAGGLSLIPSRHRLVLNGRQLYTWCALDAVGIPAGLQANARVESRCAACGAPVWLEIEAGELRSASHPDLALSLVAPDLSRSLRDGVCAEIGFYCCRAADEAGVRGLMSVAAAVQLGRELCRYGPPI